MQNIHSLLDTEVESVNLSAQSDNFSNAEKETPTQKLSLGAVLEEFEAWQENKEDAATPLPDKMWLKLFKLARCHTKTKIRALFGVSNKQYAKKHEELIGVSKKIKPASQSTPPSLCEIKITPQKSSYQPQPLPSAKTLVVEFCRSDGRVMKIHTTQDSIPTLMKAFYAEELSC